MEKEIVSSDNPNLINGGQAEADILGVLPEPPNSGDGPEDEDISVSD